MKPLPIIIDTDPGIDDALAILLALKAPELDVLGISVVAGNVPLEATVKNACKIVRLAGMPNIPVYAGADGPLVREQVFGKYAHIGTFDDTIVPPTDKQPESCHAVEFLVTEALKAVEGGERITLCSLGPLTNVALALLHHPDVASGIERIVMMGGAFTALGNRAPWAEFNCYADPHAAEIVFGSGVPVVLMPLDVTFQALVTKHHLDEMSRRGGIPGMAAATLIAVADRSDVKRFGREGGPIHDVATIAYLLKPDLFSGAPAAVGVETVGETMGHSHADFFGKGNRPINAHVMQHVDEAGFLSLVIERMAAYGQRERAE